MVHPTDVEIRDGSIRLGQLLKLAGLVDDGATARDAVEHGHVSVDGDVERRRGAQIRVGQVVRFGAAAVRVIGPGGG